MPDKDWSVVSGWVLPDKDLSVLSGFLYTGTSLNLTDEPVL